MKNIPLLTALILFTLACSLLPSPTGGGAGGGGMPSPTAGGAGGEGTPLETATQPPVSTEAAVQPAEDEKIVLAFYFPWYATQEFSGERRHWGAIDPQAQTIGRTAHYPLNGAYDSHDPQVVAWQMELARQAGLDGFIVSWWGQNSFEDRAVSLLLEQAQTQGLRIALYYEGWHTADQGVVDSSAEAAEDLLYILQTYGSHPAYLRREGKPVIFIYNRAYEQLSLADWNAILAQVNAAWPGGLLASMHAAPAGSKTPTDSGGAHKFTYAYALTEAGLDDPQEIGAFMAAEYAGFLGKAQSAGLWACLTVLPGWDDTHVRDGVILERQDGAVYRAMWEAALATDADCILVTTWNEWHEGAEIEPSAQFGDLYLTLTREFVETWKGK